MKRYRVSLVVEVDVTASTPDEAAGKSEERVQRCLDLHAKRLNAVAGADYSSVMEEEAK